MQISLVLYWWLDFCGWKIRIYILNGFSFSFLLLDIWITFIILSVVHTTTLLIRWCWMMNQLMNQMRIMNLHGNTIIIVGLHIIEVKRLPSTMFQLKRWDMWNGEVKRLDEGWIRHSTLGFGWRYELQLFKCEFFFIHMIEERSNILTQTWWTHNPHCPCQL